LNSRQSAPQKRRPVQHDEERNRLLVVLNWTLELRQLVPRVSERFAIPKETKTYVMIEHVFNEILG